MERVPEGDRVQVSDVGVDAESRPTAIVGRHLGNVGACTDADPDLDRRIAVKLVRLRRASAMDTAEP